MARAKEYLAFLKSRLPDDKVSHSVFTAEYLASFAEGIGLRHDDAVTAGLLHDCCRGLPKDELLAEARCRRMPLSEYQLEKPVLLHGPVAAEYCREHFGVGEDIYEAIYWHTTGRPGLGLLGRALYVADFAEPTRQFPEAAEARMCLRKEGFDAALRYVAAMKIEFNRGKRVKDPNTEAFNLWLTRNT